MEQKLEKNVDDAFDEFSSKAISIHAYNANNNNNDDDDSSVTYKNSIRR